MKTIETYLAEQLDSSEERRVEQEWEIADLEEALATTSGVLTDVLVEHENFASQMKELMDVQSNPPVGVMADVSAAANEFFGKVDSLVADYKAKAVQSEYLYTLEEVKVGERDDS